MRTKDVNVPALQNELVLALLCEKYHKLPSEILREDYPLMMRTWSIQQLVDKWRYKN